jgi:hypothetical protein
VASVLLLELLLEFLLLLLVLEPLLLLELDCEIGTGAEDFNIDHLRKRFLLV